MVSSHGVAAGAWQAVPRGFFLERKEPVQLMWSEIVPVYLSVSAFGRAFIHAHRSPVSLSQADFCLRIKSCTRKPLKLFLFASILIGA